MNNDMPFETIAEGLKKARGKVGGVLSHLPGDSTRLHGGMEVADPDDAPALEQCLTEARGLLREAEDFVGHDKEKLRNRVAEAQPKIATAIDKGDRPRIFDLDSQVHEKKLNRAYEFTEAVLSEL